MKNLLLILPLLFASSLEATSTRILIMDYDLDTKISVYCIGGYAFTSVRSKDNNNNVETTLIQIMRKSPEKSNKSHVTPMTCKEYMASKPVELW